MKINCKQLRQSLEKNLAPIYLLLGEEPLQTMEAGDMIRHAAAQAGYTDTRLIFITQNSDWDAFKQAAGSQSLFSEKSLIDIRLNTALSKTGSTGPNTCLLYTSPSPRDRQKSRMPSSA